MTVYIDVLIVMNIYISYFTLRAAGRILHTDIPFRRLACAAVLADTGIAVSLLLKCALTALTALTAFGFGNAKLLAVRSFVCFAVSMLICGAAVLIHEITGSDMIFSANGYVYVSISALVLVIASAVIYGALSLLRRIFDTPLTDRAVLLTVSRGDHTAVLNAVPDSGSFIRDFLTGRPVIVCRQAALEDVLPDNVAAYLSGCTDEISGIRLIPMTTASGNGLIAAFRPDAVTADIGGEHKRLDALIGVSETALKNESFDALIPAKLLR